MKFYKVLAYIIAAEVVIQAAAIAFGVFGEGHWVMDEGGEVTKAVIDAQDTSLFTGAVGFAIHGINGTMIIPLLTLVLVVTSLFMKFAGAKSAALFVLLFVAIQITLGIAAHGVVWLGPLHAANAFLVIWFALRAARTAGGTFLMRGPAVEAPAAA